jgi:fatty acid desaturase
MARLPRWLQPVLTSLTGKALPGERPWWRATTRGRFAQAVGRFGASISLSATALSLGGAWLALLPVGWLLTVSAVRIFQTGIVHHASHGNLSSNAWLNQVTAEAVSVLAWIQPLSGYKKDHANHHTFTATSADPDLRFLASVAKLRPGQSVAAAWTQFWRTMFSPCFHVEFLFIRLRAGLWIASPIRRAAGWTWTLAVTSYALTSGHGLAVLLAYVLPVALLTQMSAWAGMLGLHQWLRRDDGTRAKAEVIADLTGARFVGIRAPSPRLHGMAATAAWTRWTAQMLTTVLATRLAIIPGDLPSHDWHHWVQKADWANHAYARRDHLAARTDRAALTTEYWGIGAAIQATFERFAALPSDEQLVSPSSPEEWRDSYLGM